MGDQTAGGIAWTDETWNPIRGCRRISPGCLHCYAETMASRFSGPGQPYDGLAKDGRWTGAIRVVEKHLLDPVRWRRPRRVFVNSMSDLFFEDLHDDDIDRIFAVMAVASRHTFQVLTKRASRMATYMATDRREAWAREAARLTTIGDVGFDAIRNGPRALPNVWLGVSVEDQKRADERVPLLLTVEHAAVRFLSIEPIVGPVDLSAWPIGIGWAIVGGESGVGARRCEGDWFRSLIGQGDRLGIPIFVKQLGARYIDPMHGVCGRDLEVSSDVHVAGTDRAAALGSPIVTVRRLKDGHGGDVAEWPPMMDVRRFPERNVNNDPSNEPPKHPNRQDRRAMERHRRKLHVPAVGGAFVEILREHWPAEVDPPQGMTRMFKNARLLVFLCDRPGGLQLMMVQRLDGRDGLTWDELYEAKNVLGFADFEAIEIYPRVRHLWLLPNGRTMPFGLDKLRRSGGLG